MEGNFQIVIAGVGGQGILFTSKLFYETGLRLGLDVMGSETHGMSQRGGSVVSYVKLGNFESPMILSGSADVLYSMERDELFRNLHFLKQGGLCFVNIERREDIERSVRSYMDSNAIALYPYDADSAAMRMGSTMFANILLTGFSAGTGLIPFEGDSIRPVIEDISPESFLLKNLQAFDTGVRAGMKTVSLQ
jgi:indolepyruvate ferredoxin oxidoreductase beta subunit